MARRVDQIDDMTVPLKSHARGVDRNAALSLFWIVVRHCRAGVDHADFVNRLRIIQHLFCDGCLPGVNMSNNADISQFSLNGSRLVLGHENAL